jgi:tetratricopeptide (TPR) repeat protein
MVYKRSGWPVVAVGALLLLPACAPRLTAPPSPPSPRFQDFVFPNVPPGLGAPPLSVDHDLAWQWLQAGYPRTAQRQFESVLKKSPGFYPSETGLAFVELATEDYEDAVRRFDQVLKRSSNYAPALVGRGEALLALKRDRDALESFEAALVVDDTLDLPKRRVELLQFRVLQADLSSARRAAEAGRYDEAIVAYQQAIAASPQSAFLYREMGAIERRRNNRDAAMEQYRKAVDLDPNDAAAWRELGEVFEEGDEHPAAVDAYVRAIAIEPSAAVQGRIDRLKGLLALALLPAEYRGIPQSETLTRGGLSALIGVRFATLLDSAGARSAVVVTDTRDHWAASWIFAVTRAGVMEAYPNHTFQPDEIVRRSDFARVVGQMLDLIAQRQPAVARQWQAGRREIPDVNAAHLSYEAVSASVSSGVLPLFDDGTFQLSRPVTGAEAVAAVERLEKLVQQ